MSSSLENEDLENVPLVRMEDVQPSRERLVSSHSSSRDNDEVYETCIIDDIECENEYIVNDDDEGSNIGSMVSLHSEDVYEDDSSSQELIIPEVLEEFEAEDDLEIYVGREASCEQIYLADDLETHSEDNQEVLDPTDIDVPIEQHDVEEQIDAHLEATQRLNFNPRQYTAPKCLNSGRKSMEVEVPPDGVKSVEINLKPPSESWPTLEILPGGVIKNTDKYESDSYLYPDKIQETVANTGEMMYACAKCSQTFKYLFCLVKHVKWHEDQKKVMKDPQLGKLSAVQEELINLKRERNEIDKVYKKQKLEVFTRIAAAIGKMSNTDKFFNK